MKFISSFILSYIKKSSLFYFTCLLALYLLYHQTLGLNFDYNENLIVDGLWFSDVNSAEDFIAQILFQGLIFSIFGFLLMVQVISAYFSNQNLSLILVKKPKREWVLLQFKAALIVIVLTFFLIHYIILAAYISFSTGTLFLFNSFFKHFLYMVPLTLFITSSIIFFTVLTKNNFSRVSLIIGYLIIAPLGLEILTTMSGNLSSFSEVIVEQRQFLVPLFSHYFSDALKNAFAIESVFRIGWDTFLYLSIVFTGLSLYLFNKKVL
ncbi:MAG: hypothetical protein JJU37_06665 [Balneolaceae bacterium]|nr:hypothetical protein [Balneolaceae bacterium]